VRRAFRIMGIIGILLLLNPGCSKKSTKPSDDQEQPPPSLTGKIVFVSDRTGADELYSMNSQGTEVETLTHNGSEFPDKSYPRLSPDCTKIAFIGSSNLCILDYATGSTEILVPVSDSIGCHLGVSWSPDSKRICFCAYTHPSDDIWLFDTGTEALTRLTHTTWSDEWYPAWSPNGDLIAFSDDGDLSTMNTWGTEVRKIGVKGGYMDWSPDASKIAFNYARGDSGLPWLGIINLDGTGMLPLGDGDHPAFSPDGKQIVFNVRHGWIFRMNADGSEQVRLSAGGLYWDFDPDW
jgi:TolB protein